MAIPFFSRAARASVVGTLFLSLGFAPALGHMAPLAAAGAHHAIGRSQFNRFGFRGFNRFGFNRFDFDRSGANRFGFGRFGFDRFGVNRFGRNGWNGNQLGFGGWGYWDYPPSAPTEPAAPIIVGGGGPPAVINVYPSAAVGPSAAAGASEALGGCVIHQLQYDGAGNYVGERQSTNC
jgi:hypothetical protein